MKDNENEKNSGSRLTPNSIFFLAVKLVAFGIILYALLNNINDIFKLIRRFFSLISPLLVGGLVALILNTPMMALEKLLMRISEKSGRKLSRRSCEIISLILTFLLAVLIIYVLAYSIVPQLVESLKAIYQKALEEFPKLLSWLENLENYGINTDPITEWLNKIDVNELIKKLTDNAIKIISTLASSASSIISGASSIISGAFAAVTSVVFAVYILSNKRKLTRQLKQLSYAYVKKSIVDRICKICALSVKTFANFISGQFLEAIILGLLFFIAMTIFGFPYPLTISSLIAVTAIIPYIGAFLGCAFGMLLMVIEDPIRALWFLIMFLIIQQTENQFIYPRVVGGSVGLPAIWTFTAVIVGGEVCGILGMILFIPLFSVIYTLLKENVSRRLEERGIIVEHEEEGEVRKKKKPDFGDRMISQMQGMLKSVKAGVENKAKDFMDSENRKSGGDKSDKRESGTESDGKTETDAEKSETGTESDDD